MMDFLKYGLEHEKSGSRPQRMIARCLLEIEKRRADRFEKRLNKKQIPISESSEETDALLAEIRERIRREESL